MSTTPDVPQSKPATAPTPSAGRPSTTPPPPKSGGNLKYAMVGLLFLGGAVALWATLGEAPVPAPAPPAPAPDVQRVNPMAEPQLVLEPEPAPPLEPAPEPTPAPRKKGHSAPSAGGWSCSGEIDVARAKGIIDENRAQVRNCYERRLKVNNVLQGSLKLQVKVSSTGEVAQTSVGGSLNDEDVYACVRHLAEKWHFPPPAGGNCAVVAAPFQFSPKAD